MFEIAIREKYRYPTSKGLINTEDLYDIPMIGAHSIDAVAQFLQKQIDDSGSKSFVLASTPEDTTLKNKLEIVKHVIAVRLKEQEDRKSALSKAQEKQKILGIIKMKEDAELQSMDLKDLKAMVDSL